MTRTADRGIDNKDVSRRHILKATLLGAALPALPFVTTAQSASALTPLDANSPQAKALGYVEDTTKVDAKANPSHKPDQKCTRCAQFVGVAADKTGGCNVFPGKAVAAAGWCKVYAQKPGA